MNYSVRPWKGSTLADHFLHYRGASSVEETQKFLVPDWQSHVHDPNLLKDSQKAVERILFAVKNNEKIIVYSDYDHDGIPGGVIFHDFFKKIGFANFENYIPHRHDEGFGLNIDAVEEFGKQKVKVLITVDCGIGDVAPVARAQELGIDVVITDHHEVPKEIPKAFAIVNPKQKECKYPEKMLCGAGVAFKLIQAILAKERFGIIEGWEKWLLDMVGIATLSDMVPLIGENRVFASYGLKVLRKSPRVGLQKLLRKLKVDQRYLTEDDIGFTISPRINAASRMDTPMDAFRLLSTTDEIEADQYAEHLEGLNNERKGKVAAIVKEVRKILAERTDLGDRKIVVLGNPEWKPALLGLAANSIMDDMERPIFLWGREGNNTLKGSCRSDGSVNLMNLMGEAPMGTFLQFGGHALAGGFSLVQEKIHTLTDELEIAYEKARKAAYEAAPQWIDMELSIDQVSWDLYRQIEPLAPFGVGNPKPLFIFKNALIGEAKEFGKEKNHLELVFPQTSGKNMKAIGFFMTREGWGKELRPGERINLVATLEKSMFRSFPELRLRIVDII
jgi:single-stranded-DNA-specific exonuclease